MFKNIGADKSKYHKSKHSQKIPLNRKTTAKFKKLGVHGGGGGGTPQIFRQWDKIVIPPTKFSVLWKT